MTDIKTWSERCEVHPEHQSGMVSHAMIQMRMQEEINELRAENEGLRDALDHISEILDANAVWLNETASIIADRLQKLIEAALKGDSDA